MQIVFGSGVATRRYSMGSTEGFGKAPRQSPEIQSSQPNMLGFNDVENLAGHIRSAESSKFHEASKDVPTNLGKRERVSEEDRNLMVWLTGAVNNVAESLKQPVKEDCTFYGDLYAAVMGVPGFTEEALMYMPCHTFLITSPNVTHSC
jgi:hypothetical protein